MRREAQAPAGSVCWRCGADGKTGAPLSGCTEKRGAGPPWLHDWKIPGVDHPWEGWLKADLIDLIKYLVIKTTGSWQTCLAFGESTSASARYAEMLYREKAEKRSRLLGWVVSDLKYLLAQDMTQKGADHAGPTQA